MNDSLLKKSRFYLPVYAQIYAASEDIKIDLAATISIRNSNLKDTVILSRIDYFDTGGRLIRKYIAQPVYVAPMETIEIVISSEDNDGGSGANFFFEAYTPPSASAPLFEAVMISTSGSQGISFTSRAVRL